MKAGLVPRIWSLYWVRPPPQIDGLQGGDEGAERNSAVDEHASRQQGRCRSRIVMDMALLQGRGGRTARVMRPGGCSHAFGTSRRPVMKEGRGPI